MTKDGTAVKWFGRVDDTVGLQDFSNKSRIKHDRAYVEYLKRQLNDIVLAWSLKLLWFVVT